MAKSLQICILFWIAIVLQNSVSGQTGALIRETVEFVSRKFTKESAEVGAESMARNVESVVVRFGDDGVQAIRKVGPQTFRLVEEAGENGPAAIKLMAKHGEDSIWVISRPNRLAVFVKHGDSAAEAMIRHKEFVEPLITTYGTSAAKALANVSTQNARRIAILSNEGELARLGRTSELFDVIASYGDRAMDFIWKNKGALAVASVMTAFLANPQPFIDGTKDLASIAGTTAIKPITEQIGRQTNWTIVLLAVVIGGFGLLILWNRHRVRSRSNPI